MVATKVTANNLSDYMSQYLSDYWIDNLIWTDSSSAMTKKIEENAIINRAGISSNNSFQNELGILYEGDILTVKFPNQKETSSFTVVSTRNTEEGHEWINVEEKVPEDSDGTAYFGTGIYVSVSRRKKNRKCDKVKNYQDCIECSGEQQADCVAGCEGIQDRKDYQDCLKACRCAAAKRKINCHYDYNYSPDGPGLQNFCASNNPEMRDACDTIKQNCKWKTPTNPDPNLPTLDDIMPCICEACCEAEGIDDNPNCPFGCCNCCINDPTQSAKGCDCCQTVVYRSETEEELTTETNQQNKTSRNIRIVRSGSSVNESSIKLMENQWRDTGRNTINVKVVVKNGKNVYSFSGSGQDNNPRPELLLQEGTVYRFNLKDRSLGDGNGHPLSFATSADGNIEGSELERYIVRSKKRPGNRGSYIYFQAPFMEKTIYYYCKNHNGMGNVVNVIMKRNVNDPIIEPDVITPGTGPGGGGGVTGINECCDCDNCLMQAIMEVESGDWQNPGTKDPIAMCNARKPGNNGCGHYQIFPDFVTDARGLCPTPGIYQKGSPKDQACCGIPANAHNLLCANCGGADPPFPGTAEQCCQQKKALGELIMACWKRKWTRNQGKDTARCHCEGSGDAPLPFNPPENENCYTCEDLAKMHKEGRCGHQCCEKPNCCYQGPDADPSEGTDACNRAKQYWNRVKSVMCSISGCASQCSDCGGTTPPGGIAPIQEGRSMNTTTPRPFISMGYNPTTPPPRTPRGLVTTPPPRPPTRTTEPPEFMDNY